MTAAAAHDVTDEPGSRPGVGAAPAQHAGVAEREVEESSERSVEGRRRLSR